MLFNADNIQLFKYMFNPHLEHPHTLAFIGLMQTIGPAIPIFEMQARWFCHLLEGNYVMLMLISIFVDRTSIIGKSKLPSARRMIKDIEHKRELVQSRFINSSRHAMLTDWIPFMDELADQFGVKPNMAALAVTDPKLFFKLMFGPSYPYQYRLRGYGQWPGARQAIIDGQRRISAAADSKNWPVT